MSDLVYSVREIQAHIGDALRAVERGHRVIVTSRGRPVAELAHPRRKAISNEDAIDRKLRRLAARGKLTLAKNPGPIRVPRSLILPGAMEQWRKDRADRDRIMGIPPTRTRRQRR